MVSRKPPVALSRLTIFWTVVWTELLFLAPSVNQALAQKGKPKPPPPPPPAPVVTDQDVVYRTYDKQGTQYLVVAKNDGTNQVIIDQGKWYNSMSWHPDGEGILFTSSIPQSGIWSIRFQRNSPAPVPTLLKAGNVAIRTSPGWSPVPLPFPDSEARHVIAYSHKPTGGKWRIRLWEPTSGKILELTGERDFNYGHPSWSGDGSQLQLVVTETSAEDGYPYDLKLLTLGPGLGCPVDWSVCLTEESSLVRRIDPDQGDCYEPSQLCGDTIAILSPSFSNTGDEIAVTSDGGIWLIDKTSPAGNGTEILSNSVDIPWGTHSTWSPDDTEIMYRAAIGTTPICGVKNWEGIMKVKLDGTYPNGCRVQFLIKAPAHEPSWWRGAVQP
jgi:Tol biopolymer transport system component